MAAFHESQRGARLLDVTLPRIADELCTLNNNLAALVALLRDRVPAAPQAPASSATTEPRKHT